MPEALSKILTTTGDRTAPELRGGLGRLPKSADIQKRILVLIDQFYPILGGAEQQALRVSLEMIRRGHTVTVLTRRSEKNLKAGENHQGIDIFRLPYEGTGGIPKLRSTLPAVKWLIRHKDEYDLIHCHGSNPLEWAAMIAYRFTRKPYVVKLTNPNFLNYAGAKNGFKMETPGGDSLARKVIRAVMLPALRFMRRNMIGRAERVLAISPQITDRLRECGFVRVSNIPNGIDTEKYKPVDQKTKSKLREKLGLSQNAMIFIYTGRFAVEKNLITLLTAWNNLIQSMKDRELNLIFLGSSNGQVYSAEKELRIYARENSLASLSFKGSVFNVDEYLKASDVFVLPSLWEGMSNALLESMACGLPAIVSDIPANRGLVREGMSGMLFPPEKSANLTDALRFMIENEKQRISMGKNARVIAESNFSIEAVTDLLLKEYYRLIDNDEK